MVLHENDNTFINRKVKLVCLWTITCKRGIYIASWTGQGQKRQYCHDWDRVVDMMLSIDHE